MSQSIFFIVVLFTDKSTPLGQTVENAPTRTSSKGKVGIAFVDGARSIHKPSNLATSTNVWVWQSGTNPPMKKALIKRAVTRLVAC